MDPAAALNALPDVIARLTPRQMEVISYLALGMSNKQIGSILNISRETVRAHINKACRRVEVENRTQLVVIYTKWQTLRELEQS